MVMEKKIIGLGDNMESQIEVVDGYSQREDIRTFLKRWNQNLSEDRRTYGTKLCFAGVENKKIRDGLYRIGARNIVLSYYYLKSWLSRSTVQEIGEDLGRFDYVVLESGVSALKKKNKSIEEIEKYCNDYYSDLVKIHHMFALCIEADAFEEKKLASIRKKCFENGIKNIVPIYTGGDVSHLLRNRWFECYPCIALDVESKNFIDIDLRNNIDTFFSFARSHGVLVHGRTISEQNNILGYPFFSIDSTSWLSGSKYGLTLIFQKGRIKFFSKNQKDVRKRFKSRFESAGLSWRSINADSKNEIDLMNALAWLQWSDYIKYDVNKTYWLSSSEKDRALDLKSIAFNVEGLIDRKSSIERASNRRNKVVRDADYDDRAHETMHCDQCHISGRCPRFKSGQPCGYDLNLSLETHKDLQRALKKILEVQYGRVMTSVLFEKIDGGIIDPSVSKEIENIVDLIKNIKSIFDPREEITIQAKGGSGAVTQMLSAVFRKGSGNTSTERSASADAEKSALEMKEFINSSENVIDVESEEIKNVKDNDG